MELVITAMIITIISAQFILYLCDHGGCVIHEVWGTRFHSATSGNRYQHEPGLHYHMLDFCVPYDTDVERVRKIIKKNRRIGNTF